MQATDPAGAAAAFLQLLLGLMCMFAFQDGSRGWLLEGCWQGMIDDEAVLATAGEPTPGSLLPGCRVQNFVMLLCRFHHRLLLVKSHHFVLLYVATGTPARSFSNFSCQATLTECGLLLRQTVETLVLLHNSSELADLITAKLRHTAHTSSKAYNRAPKLLSQSTSVLRENCVAIYQAFRTICEGGRLWARGCKGTARSDGEVRGGRSTMASEGHGRGGQERQQLALD